MTGLAGRTRHNSVVHRRTGKARGVLVTGIALRRARNVIAGLALGRCAVVAGRASAGRHTRMTEGGRRPGRGLVAGIARCRCDQVGTRLASGGAAVVTRRAGAGSDAGVAECSRQPCRGFVAGVARRTGRQVRTRLAGRE